MAFKNLDSKNKKRKVVERFRNRASVPDMDERKAWYISIIDTALKSLYNEGDKVTRSLQADILKPNRIKITEKEAARIWDMMVNTGLANSVIGFGNAGKLTLTNEGYQLMNQFGSYSAFLEERKKQSEAQAPGLSLPQFIIEQVNEGNEDNSGADVAEAK